MTSDDAAQAGPAEGAARGRGRSLAGHTAVMAAGTLVSRVLGLVRNTILLVAAIGVTGIAADAYSVANRLPNVMFAVLAAGVLNSALVPQIVRAFADGRERTVHRILTIGTVGVFAVTVVFTLMAGFWVNVFSDRWGPEQTALAIAFALWCIPQLAFYGLYSLLGQVLNAREQFGPFMWAPVANNVVAIAGLAVYLAAYGRYAPGADPASPGDVVDEWTAGPIFLIAGVATLGIAAQALVLIVPLVRGGYRPRWVWRGPKGELSTVAKVAGWALGAVLVEQVGVALVTRVATAAPLAAAAADAAPGTPASELVPAAGVAGAAVYDMSLTMYLLPHSLVAISLMTVLFTQMSRFASEGNLVRLRESLSEGVRLVGVFMMLASAVLFVAAPHVVRALAMTADGDAIDAVAWVLRFMVIGLVPLGASVMFKQAYFALEDGRTVFLIHIAMTAAWLAVAYGFRWAVEPRWWVAGVALGLTATNVVAVVLRMWGLRSRLGGVDGRRIVLTYAKSLTAALIAAVPGGAVMWLAPTTWNQEGATAVAGSAAVAVAVALVMAATYVLMSRALRIPETAAAARAVSRRFRRVR